MSKAESPEKSFSQSIKELIGKFLYSNIGGKLANMPPFSWIARWVGYYAAGKVIREVGKTQNREPYVDLISSLQGIAYDVVNVLGYAGAMVAPYETGDVLPVRAFYFNPEMITNERVKELEDKISTDFGHMLKPEFCPDGRVSLTSPDIARVYVHKEAYRKNLGVQAAEKREYIISDELFDLFTPIAPDAAKNVIGGIQGRLGIQQVITLPFFIETKSSDGTVQKEYVGNLFAAKQGKITEKDIELLSSFAYQAAAAIRSERRRQFSEIVQDLILDMQRELKDETKILKRIVEGVVTDLHYPGAMVATYEASSDALPVRALYVNPEIIEMEDIHKLEDQLSSEFGAFLSPEYCPENRLSLTDPKTARVYVKKDEYKGNLGVQAARAEKPTVSKWLFDLFVPIAPEAARSAIEGIQKRLDIRQVIAVPFFAETLVDGQFKKELVGNLFAATQSQNFTQWEIDLLQAFGQQAAVGLQNARIYRQAKDRRQAAEIFGKMAFTATATLHAFRNDLGTIRMGFQMLDSQNKDMSDMLMRRIDRLVNRLESLKEPFSQNSTLNEPVNINTSLQYALMKAREVFEDQFKFENLNDTSDTPHVERLEKLPKILVEMDLQDNLPKINTVPEMLSEAFKVLIKNAVEAIAEKESDNRLLTIHSELSQEKQIMITIQDNGKGIKPEYLEKVFELGTTTKKTGLGFGLFWTKDYIEGLGGTIAMSSIWGEGTTLNICLPTTNVPLHPSQEVTK